MPRRLRLRRQWKSRQGLRRRLAWFRPSVRDRPPTFPRPSSSDDELSGIRKNLRTSLGTINFIRNDGQWDESVLYGGPP